MATVRVEVFVGDREYSVAYDVNEVEEIVWGGPKRIELVGDLNAALDLAVADMRRAVGKELK